MKFKKPSETTLVDSAAGIGGGVVGAMVSNGVFGLIHTPTGATGDKNAALLKRGALLVVGAVLAASIDGKDAASSAAKGAGAGIAIIQASEIAKSFASDSTAIKTGAAATTKTQKFISNAFGLACPCTGSLNGARRRRKPSLRMVETQPYFDNAPSMQLFGNALDNAFDQGQMAS